MITIKLRLTQPFATELITNVQKAPYDTTCDISNAGEDSIEVSLSHEKLQWIVQDCFYSGIYAGLNRMIHPINQDNDTTNNS